MARTSGDKVTGSAKATVDHDEIRRWVEQHGGWPAEVARAAGEGETGILRVDFPGGSGEQGLQRISWDEFFQKFDRSNLAFLYQDATKTGRPSRWSKLVGRESAPSGRAEAGGERRGGNGHAPARRRRTGGEEATERRAAGGRGAAQRSRGAKAAQGRGGGGARKGVFEARGRFQKGARGVKGAKAGGEQGFEQRPIELLKQQHREAVELLGKLQGRGANRRSRERVFDELVTALAIHFDVEEQVFYPSLKKRQTEEVLLESAEEHLGCKRILADLIDLAPDDPTFEPKVEVLRKLVEMHIEHEENELFPIAERILKGEQKMAVTQEMTRVMEEIRSGGEARDRLVEHTGEAAQI